jgi:hypothetical protein
VTITLTDSGIQPGPQSVTLSCAPNMSSVVGYNEYRSVISGGTYTRMNFTLIATSQYTDTIVQAGQTYVATSVDLSNQKSPYSHQVSAMNPTP